MNPIQILYPPIPIVALVFILVLWLGAVRVRAVQSGRMPAQFYRLFQGAEEPEQLRVLSRHLANLFELPVLFYLACVTAYITAQVDMLLVGLAWLYVVTRYIHCAIHLTINVVAYRGWTFVFGLLVLVLMWIILTVRIIGTDSAIPVVASL